MQNIIISIGLTLFVCALRPASAAAPPLLSIDKAGDNLRLRVQADIGRAYNLESASSLGLWRPVAAWNHSNPIEEWLQPTARTSGQQFFRLAEFKESPVLNFRLIDLVGRAQELAYQQASAAVVLTFIDFRCPDAPQAVNSIHALRNQFPSVLFWLIDATGQLNRTALNTQAAPLAKDLVVLQDRGQLVTRSFGVRSGIEAIVIDPKSWSTVYRGQIEPAPASSIAIGQGGSVADALTRFLAGQPIHFLRSQPQACSLPEPPSAVPSYATEIAPLLQAKCVGCHSPGNIAPWSMTHYELVRSFADPIKQEVLAGRMPPWHADPQFGSFSNDSSLLPAEASKLLRWIDAGAPRGSGPDPLENAASLSDYPLNWPADLGQPDVILTVPTQSVRPSGEEPYHYVNVPTQLTSDVWVRASVVLPGNLRVVHHCLVYFGSNSQLRGLDGYFAGYVPGAKAVAYPDTTGKFLPKGTVLQVQLHYTTTGESETDQTRIGLYLAKSKPQRELKTRAAFNVFFSIPPGTRDHEVSGEYPFAKDAWLYEMSPHMHYRGSRFRFEVQYPNGTRETLLNVPRYAFDWQTLYRLDQPKFLPAGSTLICTGAWDNSSLNPYNPDPNATIRFGEQTDDEMFIGYFNFSE